MYYMLRWNHSQLNHFRLVSVIDRLFPYFETFASATISRQSTMFTSAEELLKSFQNPPDIAILCPENRRTVQACEDLKLGVHRKRFSISPHCKKKRLHTNRYRFESGTMTIFHFLFYGAIKILTRWPLGCGVIVPRIKSTRACRCLIHKGVSRFSRTLWTLF